MSPQRYFRPMMLLGLLIALCALAISTVFVTKSAAADEQVVVFSDDMENGTNGWVVETESQVANNCLENWRQLSEPTQANSGTSYWTNAPYTDAGGSGTCFNFLISPQFTPPANTISLTVNFAHKHSTEACCDVGGVQVSVDGQNWETISPGYMGMNASFLGYDAVSLPSTLLARNSPMQLRFVFASDALATEVGWFIDDVEVVATTSDVVPTFTPTAEPGGENAVPIAEVDHGYRFSPIVIVDKQRDVAEPSLRIDPNWNVYTCGPFGASRATEYAQKSFDRGDTFRVLGQAPKGQIATGGGGDCELALGTELNSEGNYTLSYTGLEALLNFSTATSSDEGASFIGQNLAVLSTAVDRQWMEGVFDDVVYLGYNSIGQGYAVARSTDGGFSYDPPVVGATDVQRPGPLRIDADVTHNPQGNEILYFAYTTANGDAGGVKVARSLDQGQTWETFVVVEAAHRTDKLFAGLGIDTDGNLYAVWTEGETYNAYYSYSVRGENGAGETWSEKQLVNRQPVMSTMMPWIEAGDPGRIAVSFYGTATDGNTVELAGFNAAWHVYLSTSFNALSADADFDITQVTTHPIHWDGICASGLGCTLNGGDRTLLDFFQNRIAPDGSIGMVYNQSNKIPTNELGEIAIVSYSKQTQGPSMYATGSIDVDNRPNVRTSAADPLDDAQFPISGLVVAPSPAQIPAMEITNLELEVIDGAEIPGTFEIRMHVEDLSTTALTNALADQVAAGAPAASLIYAVRFFSGIEPYSAVAKYDGVSFTFGFNDLEFATVEGTKLQTYPGGDVVIPGEVDLENNIIKMTVAPNLFEAIDLNLTGQDPTLRTAQANDTIYSVTGMTFGNQNADPTLQEYLNDVDVTAPFDFVLQAAPLAVDFVQTGRALTAESAADTTPVFTATTALLLFGSVLVFATFGSAIYLTWQRRR